ncbi:hypothetical protein ACH5RR_014744 [Cinchona calisaya]|uniref:Uncharacterized protein n=1 Tax=Cinchona calisaya TaxID=153742 RepID=A0ABD2ZUP4_9GENT
MEEENKIWCRKIGEIGGGIGLVDGYGSGLGGFGFCADGVEIGADGVGLALLECPRMQSSREAKKQRLQQLEECKALCRCNCKKLRPNFSSSEESEISSNNSDRYPTISSLAQAMVQERLDQMIKDRGRDNDRQAKEQSSL